MTLVQRYNTELQHVSSKKLFNHLFGRFLVEVAIGVFFWRQLEHYAGVMLIAGILLMLPVLSHVLQERGQKRNRDKKRKSKR